VNEEALAHWGAFAPKKKGCEDTWLFFAARRGPRVKKVQETLVDIYFTGDILYIELAKYNPVICRP
jgi:hypothetical protein